MAMEPLTKAWRQVIFGIVKEQGAVDEPDQTAHATTRLRTYAVVGGTAVSEIVPTLSTFTVQSSASGMQQVVSIVVGRLTR